MIIAYAYHHHLPQRRDPRGDVMSPEIYSLGLRSSSFCGQSQAENHHSLLSTTYFLTVKEYNTGKALGHTNKKSVCWQS